MNAGWLCFGSVRLEFVSSVTIRRPRRGLSCVGLVALLPTEAPWPWILRPWFWRLMRERRSMRRPWGRCFAGPLGSDSDADTDANTNPAPTAIPHPIATNHPQATNHEADKEFGGTRRSDRLVRRLGFCYGGPAGGDAACGDPDKQCVGICYCGSFG